MDDATLGVAEPLNETGPDGRGLIVRGMETCWYYCTMSIQYTTIQ